MSKNVLKNERINQVTGATDYYFPLEIHCNDDRVYAKLHGLEIGWARLGFRYFEAIFVPCKIKAYDANGNEIYLDTPSEDQHRFYLELIKDEMNAQEALKQDGRCNIPDGSGGIKRCPLRVPNPNYVPGSNETKTIPVKCEGCIYEQFRQEHSTVTFSCLEHKNDDGSTENFEAPSPAYSYEGERYERMRTAFIDFVKERYPNLVDLAELLTLEFSRSEAARELDIPVSTAGSRREKLKKVCTEFLESTVIL